MLFKIFCQANRNYYIYFIMILSKVEKLKNYKIKKINVAQKDKRKLYKLGIYNNVQIFLVEKIAGGGVIVSVGGADIVVGKNVADKIIVELC